MPWQFCKKSTGPVVLPTTPSFLPGLRTSTEEKRLTRLDLANWITSKDNPITGRTVMNRTKEGQRDLRLFDHAPLVSAALRGPLLCVYIVEPSLWAAPDAARAGWTCQ